MSEPFDRYWQKIKIFIKNPGMQKARMNDLLTRIKEALPRIEALLAEYGEHWSEEDCVYRFYHSSFKVFHLQDEIKKGFALISEIGGKEDPPNETYVAIVKEGTEHDFDMERTNANWLAETRPILEAFWHTKYFLSMMAKYGKELPEAPQCLPSGWAAVLYLFELR
jgi:hypothetical protein